MFKKKGAVGFSKVKPIATIDPYSLEAYIFKDNLFENGSSKSLAQDNLSVSYIQTKDIISSTVEIGRNIPDDDLKDAIEIKAYDELGLDSGIEYEIYYFEAQQQSGSNERMFNVIAVDKESLFDIFKDVKKVKYIDYITTAPFLFKSLYSKNILEAAHTDCFIYFHKDDAHVTIYKDGEYIFSKSIRYSLGVILDTFSESLGKRVDESEFYGMLSKSGLQNSDPAYQKELMKLFGEVFVYINDVILYAKRAYSLENIDKIYISSELGDINGLEEFCHNYVNIPSEKLTLKIAKNAEDLNVNAIHSLMALSANSYVESGKEGLNLSIFKRPPPFKSRPSGKLAQLAAAALFFSMAYPAYQYVEDTMFLQKDLSKLDNEYSNLSRQSTQRKAILVKLDAEHKKVDEKLAAKGGELDFRTKLLHEIYMKKVSYPMKAKILTSLFDKVVKHESKIVSVDNNSSDMVITVRSKEDKHVTELLSELANFREYDVSTQTIKKDENGTYYESAIKVGLDVR
jgi:hypothetical protein